MCLLHYSEFPQRLLFRMNIGFHSVFFSADVEKCNVNLTNTPQFFLPTKQIYFADHVIMTLLIFHLLCQDFRSAENAKHHLDLV